MLILSGKLLPLRVRGLLSNGPLLLLSPDILPPKSPCEAKCSKRASNAKVHDAVDTHTVVFKHDGELVARHKLAYVADPGVDNNICGGSDFGDVLLELPPQRIAEECVGGNEEDRAADVLAEDDDGHCEGDLRRGNEVLHGNISLLRGTPLVTDYGRDDHRVLQCKALTVVPAEPAPAPYTT